MRIPFPSNAARVAAVLLLLCGDLFSQVADSVDQRRHTYFKSPVNNQGLPGAIRIYEPANAAGNEWFGLRASYSLTQNQPLIWPVAPPSSGQFLQAVSSDSLKWGSTSNLLTVREVDGSPSFGADILEFSQDSGFVVTNPDGTTARVELSSLVSLLGQTIESADITDGEIANVDISSSAGIELSKLAAGTSAQVIVVSGSGVPTYRAMSGDASIDNLGVLTVTDDSHAHSIYTLKTTTLTAGNGLNGGGDLSTNRSFGVNVDFDGGIEIVDDSLNVKLDGGTLALSSAGLKVGVDAVGPEEINESLDFTWMGQHDFSTGEFKTGIPFRFEGSVDNGVYTTLAVTDPTTARTVTLPDASGEVTLLGQEIDLSGSEASGTLAAARFPALTGHVTTTAGNLATTIANNVIAVGMIADGDHGAFTYGSNIATLDAGSVSGGTGGIITDESITVADLGTNSVAADEIAADAVGASELAESEAYSFTGSVTFDIDALHILDTNASHDLIISPGSDLTADHTLTITTGDADRALTLAGDATISGTNTGDVTLAGTPDYITISGQVITRAQIDLAADVTGTLPDGNVSDNLTLATVSGAIDAGAATSFELPNDASVTTDAFGEIAADNDAWASGRGALQFFDGTANTNIVGVLTSDTPNDGDIPKYNSASGTITWEADAGASAGAPTSATYLVASLDGTLTDERRLQGTANEVALADGGANGDMVISLPTLLTLSAKELQGGTLFLAEGATADGFEGTFNVADFTADRTITFPDLDGTVTLLGNTTTGSGNLVLATSPTIETPTIASFANATHDHEDAAGGGQLDHGLALTGLTDDDHTQYHLVAGRAGDAFIVLPTDPGDGAHGDAPTVTLRAKYNPTGATGVTAKDLTLVHNITDSETGASQLDFNFGAGVIAALSESSIGTLVGTSGTQTLTNKTIDGNSNTLTVIAGQYAAASIDGDDINSNIAGSGLVLTAGSPDILDFAPSELTNITFSNGGSATGSITFDLDGSIDPVISFGDGIVNISAGTLQEGGNAVFTTADGALADDDLSNNSIDDLSDVTITTAAAANIIVRNAGNTAWENVVVSGDGSISAAGALTVNDDSHAHTGATLSGIDISDDTNLTAGDHLTLTGDDLDVDDDFVLNTGDIIAGNLNFADGSGASPQLLFTPETGTIWAFYVEDTGDDLQVEVNTGATETLDIVNAGAGVINVTIDGSLTASNVSGTNTGDQTISLTGDVTGSGTGSFAATIANDAVTFAKFQNITDARLLGRSAGSSGDMQEITIGSGLSLSGGELSATGGGGSWSDLSAPTGAVSMVSDGTSETATFDFQAAFTTGNQFTIKQTTGNPSGGSLFAVQAADANVSPIMLLENTAAVTIPVGLQIAATNGSGVLTTAIDVSDAEIVTALAIGSNDVTVGGATISSAEFAILDNAIDLSGAEATGILAAGRFPALTGDVTTSEGSLTTTIGADKILESMLKAVNAAVDEDILTFESTTGDFEWHTPAELGLVATSRQITIAGTTNEITSSAGAQDLSADRTWTLSLPATIDLGGKTSFEIPNGTNPTVDAIGELAWDSDDNALRVYNGSTAYSIPINKTAQATIIEPEKVQLITDAVSILSVESSWAPFGITLVKVGIKTNASSSYSVNFEEWTSPTDGAPATIETVATSSTTEAEDDGTLTDASIAAGSIVKIDLPTTDISELTVWIVYRINVGD